jgi:hypothetical protein
MASLLWSVAVVSSSGGPRACIQNLPKCACGVVYRAPQPPPVLLRLVVFDAVLPSLRLTLLHAQRLYFTHSCESKLGGNGGNAFHLFWLHVVVGFPK